MELASQEAIARTRYRVVPGQVLPVAIERPDSDQPPLGGELSDITVCGARIHSEAPLRFGERFALHLESESVGLGIAVCCQTQWVRRGSSDDEWVIGCLFESRLELDSLEEYVDSGLLERRESDRRGISLPATIQFELSSEETDVELKNIGPGGFCFLSQTPGDIGSRILATIHESDAEQVEGRIKWQSTNNGEYRIGCQWSNRQGRALARRIWNSAEEPVLKNTRSRVTQAAIIAAVAFSLGMLVASWSSSAQAFFR
jgi:hypothetical protein